MFFYRLALLLVSVSVLGGCASGPPPVALQRAALTPQTRVAVVAQQGAPSVGSPGLAELIASAAVGERNEGYTNLREAASTDAVKGKFVEGLRAQIPCLVQQVEAKDLVFEGEGNKRTLNVAGSAQKLGFDALLVFTTYPSLNPLNDAYISSYQTEVTAAVTMTRASDGTVLWRGARSSAGGKLAISQRDEVVKGVHKHADAAVNRLLASAAEPSPAK